ncbi:MBL fold metallo-hydrolase [Fusibacter sp. JL298sf-3]
MILERIVVGSYAANCYIVADENTREAIVIDPGSEGERICERLEALNVQVKKIVLTHGHGDHIGGAEAVKAKTGAPVVIHHDDAEMLGDPIVNLTATMRQKVAFTPDATIGHLDTIEVGTHRFEVRHTPGHTRGGICLIEKNERIVFSGDTLFYGSVGRSDLSGGNHKTLIASIIRELMPLEDDFTVYSGHGSSTTVGFERRKNPFIQG